MGYVTREDLFDYFESLERRFECLLWYRRYHFRRLPKTCENLDLAKRIEADYASDIKTMLANDDPWETGFCFGFLEAANRVCDLLAGQAHLLRTIPSFSHADEPEKPRSE